MATSKSEKVKSWLKDYLSEFKEYSGTVEELAKLAGASTYLIKKVIGELEEEGFLKSDSKRGRGLFISVIQPEPSEPVGEEKVEAKETTQEKKKEKKKSLQDQVLSSLLGKDVVVFLISGTRLEGKLLDFDNFTLAMTAPKGKSLVYKHAVATILFE
ncbi:RNA chaperone Hfq [Thermovibrio ammonificans]|jgi:RNA chaperone Hfq|uniref:Like-Sm ribonucleoprotein core n=1 Tax=Thermovibrio ammonificans (strain DSM 15698 / JCM 12110 / HB-1) TaxID=648996 RepID=E8T3Y6_THEA1|nr:RNA chaperone Hfq [Thermovibrio ammonificans]ADU96196.1 Like-Sm ribonucleoprotein core [Thermovibrio ammonificans HB-1]